MASEQNERGVVIVTDAETLQRVVEAAVRAALKGHQEPARPDLPEWLDVRGAAKVLDVCQRTVTNMAKAGTLPAHRVGRLWRFRREDVLDCFERMHVAV